MFRPRNRSALRLLLLNAKIDAITNSMTHDPISALWRSLPRDLASRIESCLDGALASGEPGASPVVFFRADDVAVPGRQFERLLELFLRFRAPLSLAVVPAWITPQRWQALQRISAKAPALWCWHQHGWRHKNHALTGRKQEFGDQRSKVHIRADLCRGRQRLEALLGLGFYPAFTPPWNRCGDKTLRELKAMGYRALSRSHGSLPRPPDGLAEFAVNVDLHTRKEKRAGSGWQMLWRELSQALAGGRCGIMIHHQRINDAAFGFLEELLRALTRRNRIDLVHLKDLAEQNG